MWDSIKPIDTSDFYQARNAAYQMAAAGVKNVDMNDYMVDWFEKAKTTAPRPIGASRDDLANVEAAANTKIWVKRMGGKVK